MVAFMVSLAFVVGVVVGILATIGAIVVYRSFKRPTPEVPAARILERQYPAHLKEARILTYGTKVEFLNEGQYTPAIVTQYHREPGRGNRYLVSWNTPGHTHGKWVADNYVWEDGDRRVA